MPVTTTPTVTASLAAPTATVDTTAGGADRSNVVGRKFDLGRSSGCRNDGAVPVIIFDRWTEQGVTDSTRAAKGLQIHEHSDAPYQNHNSKITNRIPVARGRNSLADTVSPSTSLQ